MYAPSYQHGPDLLPSILGCLQDSPYFYTTENSQRSFNAQTTDEGGEEGGEKGHELAVILGTTAGAVAIMGIGLALVVGVLWAVRRRRVKPSKEYPNPKTSLITKTSRL